MDKNLMRWLIFFKWTGNAATVALVVVVMAAVGTWKIGLFLIPMILLIEFGCFAERDIQRIKDS